MLGVSAVAYLNLSSWDYFDFYPPDSKWDVLAKWAQTSQRWSFFLVDNKKTWKTQKSRNLGKGKPKDSERIP